MTITKKGNDDFLDKSSKYEKLENMAFTAMEQLINSDNEKVQLEALRLYYSVSDTYYAKKAEIEIDAIKELEREIKGQG